MNLQLGGLLLVAALFLSSSALTPDECKPLLTPLSLDNVSTMYGRWNFHMGFIDNEAFRAILKVTESSWMNITLSDDKTFVTQQEKLNGTCLATKVEVHINGDTVTISVPNITSHFHLIPGCDGCMVMNIKNTARNLGSLVQKLHLNANVTDEELHFPALYLMARESSLQDSDLERFKQQASCLGFSGEPDYHYDPKNEFCAEGEGVMQKFVL
ncbi:uncharacterized protein LOC131984614 [Centropristis striata]|uniref:uncharacterized protein LOC131984614 n=1 Tax=Centropristis striata TaxID=184440 RepID=UPI0027E1CFD9|nr:uncharacterized protein LOC131984614 [Centropristis striata]